MLLSSLQRKRTDTREDEDPSANVVLRAVQDLTFYGVLGIKDPLRADVKTAVADCHRAGINVRM